MPPEGQYGTGWLGIEGFRIISWLAQAIEHHARRKLFTLIACYLDLAFGDHRGGNVKHQRFAASYRNASGDRVC